MIKEDGYIINIEKEHVVTPTGYILESNVLSDVHNMYERLTTTNYILDTYPFDNVSKQDAWNLSKNVRELMITGNLKEDEAMTQVMDNYFYERGDMER